LNQDSNRPAVAIIPARGGSKGIPKKNLVSLGGRPLISYSIEHAMASHRVDRVVVSTDDDEIADVSTQLGAEVIRRPDELAGDTATSESALLHVLDELHATEGFEPELVVFLQATSPLRRPSDIDSAIELLVRKNADSLFSACATHGFIWRRTREELQSLTYDFRHRQRRQDIGEDYLENGSIYVFKPEVLRETGNRLGGRIEVFKMDPLDSFQIDGPADLDLIERILSQREASGDPAATWPLVRLLVLDFDGVLTDNHVIVHQDGTESVVCHRGDGLGIEHLIRAGTAVVVLSKERNPVVAARCDKLGVKCLHGVDQKLPELQRLANDAGLDPSEIAYVGNDVNDVSCMEWVGLPIAVADATPEALAAAVWVTQEGGGRGAIREVCNQMLRKETARE
jgi:YrbI family 3-deoxy-D-manno-octulosonate 8-phosphate phosphatase